MNRGIAYGMICLLIGVSFSSLSSCKNHQKNVGDMRSPVCITDSLAKMIHIDSAMLSNIDDEVKLSGEISFNDNSVVKVYPFSSGQVLKVNVSLGDKVTKGQALAVIKSAEVAGNYADLSEAGNDVAISRKQLDNMESLYKNGIASEKDYAEAKENYQKTVSAAEKIREQIRINGGGNTFPDGTYIIKSPMNGYVVEKKISQGGFIRSDNNDNLFTIGDIREVWVWANVYETDIARIKEGNEAQVATLAYPDTTFTGVVDKVNKILEPETKVMKVRIRLKNPGMLLKPEMFANIIVTNKGTKKAVTIPADAMVSDNSKNYVIVYHSQCNLELREVSVLKSTEGKLYLSSGLEIGEKLVAQNQVLLFNALKEN